MRTRAQNGAQQLLPLTARWCPHHQKPLRAKETQVPMICRRKCSTIAHIVQPSCSMPPTLHSYCFISFPISTLSLFTLFPCCSKHFFIVSFHCSHWSFDCSIILLHYFIDGPLLHCNYCSIVCHRSHYFKSCQIKTPPLKTFDRCHCQMWTSLLELTVYKRSAPDAQNQFARLK